MDPISFVEARTLYCADNLQQLVDFPSECVDLIYLDPPFFSNRNYEVIWGDEAEVRSFEDRWEGGVQVYINWMKDRLVELHRLLKPTGSLYLHCDHHAGHRLKLMLDDVFGENRFQNEVVWYYRGGGVSPARWARRHDTIFFYSKGIDWTFNVDPVRTEYSESVVESSPSRYDKSYRGDRVYSGYKPNPLGKHPDDVWPIQPLMPSDKRERLGYPTQKPETLLERIILASSNPGDLVLDPFCGCGTTIAVAERLKRQWIGIDISPTAVGLMKRRVEKVGAKDVRVVGLPMTVQELKELRPFEFQNWVMQRLNGTHSPRKTGDMGIDGFSFMQHDPIQVKQSERIGRKTVDEFETAVERAGKSNGFVIAFTFTKGAYEEAARAKAEKKIDIRLIKAADLLGPEDQPDLRIPELSEIFPKAAQTSFLDLPLPGARAKDARPSPFELIESDRASRIRQ
jgi:DNA modification methylase